MLRNRTNFLPHPTDISLRPALFLVDSLFLNLINK